MRTLRVELTQLKPLVHGLVCRADIDPRQDDVYRNR